MCSGSRDKGGQGRKLNVLNSVSERVARGRNDKLEEDLISTYAALEHNKGTYYLIISYLFGFRFNNPPPCFRFVKMESPRPQSLLCSGRKKQLLSQEQFKLRKLMSVRLCPVSVINTARHELHSQGGLRDIYNVIFVSPLVF